MARIRTIKPEMWGDEKFAALDSLSQLVFIGLISQADDFGRLIDSVRLIDGLLWPYDDSRTSRESLANLSRAGLIDRGTAESGKPIIQIVGWDRHQRVDKPNEKNCLPPIVNIGTDLGGFANDSRMIRDALANSSRPDLRPTTYDLRPTTYERNAHARGDFNDLYQSRPSGPLVTAEAAYFEAVDAGADHDTMKRRWLEYVDRQECEGLNVPHLANWLRKGGYADASLDMPRTAKANGIPFPDEAP